MDGQVEKKKSFWLVYTLVAVYYIAMIITYGLVVHHAAENGAITEVECNPKADKSCKKPVTYAAKEYSGY